MKKYLIAGVFVVVLAFVAYLVFANRDQTPTATVTPAGTPVTEPTGSPSATGPASLPPTSTTPTPTKPVGQYKDGTYTGTVAGTIYGNIQAVAVIQGGALVDVTFPQAPSGGHSSEVSAMALPALKQEAIAAQGANINIVSGATQDSQAFQQSLGSALAQAKS